MYVYYFIFKVHFLFHGVQDAKERNFPINVFIEFNYFDYGFWFWKK